MKNKKVWVKLTGDGTRIGKHIHVVNFGFTLFDEGDKVYSASGNHCLAIFKEPKTYELMKNALKDIVSEMEFLSSITVSDMSFTIDYFLGGIGSFWQWQLGYIVLHPIMLASSANAHH